MNWPIYLYKVSISCLSSLFLFDFFENNSGNSYNASFFPSRNQLLDRREILR